jgi:hypothetical protein
MFNPIDKLIKTVHGIGKEATRFVVPTIVEPAKPTRPTAPARPVISESVTYCRIVVNGKIYEGQEAIDFLNSK